MQQKLLYAAKQQKLKIVGELPVLTYKDMNRLSEGDRAVNRASHDYYQALLRGACEQELQQLLQTWLGEMHKRWPDLRPPDPEHKTRPQDLQARKT